MRIELDQKIQVKDKNVYYTVVSYHRNSSLQNKSKWTISRLDEFNCFAYSEEKEWLINHQGWGVIPDGNKLIELGKNSESEKLYISKFVDSEENNIWHGYPADYRRNTQDIPTTQILTNWYNDGLIKKHHILKIKRGKKCNL